MIAEQIEILEFFQIDPDLYDWEQINTEYWQWIDSVTEQTGMAPWELSLNDIGDFYAYIGSRSESGTGLWEKNDWEQSELLHRLAIDQGTWI